MATYVPGVGSYLPEFKPFTPDYKFLSNVLDTKTTKYQTNFKQLNDLYSKVVYGNLSRKDTQEMRDQYAENLAPKLQQIAGADLSMAQNVDAAKALFRPFFEEDIIVKDLAMTKTYRNEMQYANMLKNSTVQEEREKYWQTGIQKMQYDMEDFVNADPGKALNMGMIRYTPDSDLYQMAMKLLDESELGTDVVTTISENGEWMIHRKNGDLITNEALTMVQKALKDDPLVVNAYHADAFVKSRQYADQGIEEGRFQSIDQGQHEWATNKISEIEAEIAKRKAAAEEQRKLAEQKNTAWQDASKQNGIVKGSPEEKLMNENKSDLVALQERLKELNTLENNQPASEKNFKTTGQYDPADTQSLLYRAYGLMMNYNMESDLQAAALNYSKKDMMVKLEANDYAVMAKKHKYDMAKIATQHANRLTEIATKAQYDLEVEKEKLKMMGLDKLEGLGDATTTTEDNTLTAVTVDEDGNLDYTGDVFIDNELKGADLQGNLDQSKLAFALETLKNHQQQTNGGSGLIKIDGLGEKSEKQFLDDFNKILFNTDYEDEAVKAKYKEAFDKMYKEVGDMITDISADTEALGDGSPLLFNTGDRGEQFAEMQNRYDALQEQQMALDHHIEKLYETVDFNIKTAANSNFDLENGTEFMEAMQAAVNAGMPTLIYKDEDGVSRRYTDEEFKDAYWKWIQSGGGDGISVEDIDVDGFDDSSAWKHYSKEHSQLGDGTMASLGEGKQEVEYMAYSGGLTSSGISTPGIPVSSGTAEFNKVAYKIDPDGPDAFIKNRNRSDKQAQAFLDSFYELNNLAMKGKLEYDAKIKVGNTDDVIESNSTFKTYDILQGMRGISQPDQNSGEIYNNPAYQVTIDPLAISDDAAEFIKLADKSIRNGETSGMFIAPVGFNEIQKDDLVQDDDSEILDAGDGAGSFTDTEEQHRLGKLVYDQYIMDLTKRRTTESKAQGDYPIAKITYFSSWTSDGDRVDSPYAGYKIQLSDEYMAGLRKTGGILEGKKDYGNVISIVIPKDKDKNPRKYGEFNFSYVASEIASSDEASFKKSVPSGGSFSITEDVNGMYNINFEVMQFNAETGEYNAAKFTRMMEDDQGNILGQQNRMDIDYYMRQYLYRLQKIGRDNIIARDKWKKANPDKVVEEPLFTFDS
jgi:hypothetical protein